MMRDPLFPLAARLDFRVPGLADLEVHLADAHPAWLAMNPTHSEDATHRILRAISTRRTGEPGFIAQNLARSRRMSPVELDAALSSARLDPVVAALVEGGQAMTKDRVARLVADLPGAQTTAALLARADTLLTPYAADLGPIIDRAPSPVRMLWLAYSTSGDYTPYAARWVATAPSARASLSPWIARLAALHRPDLRAAFVTSPALRARTAVARTGTVVDPAEQAALLRLPDPADVSSVRAWASVDRESAVGLVSSTRLDDDVRADFLAVATALVSLDLQTRSGAPRRRAQTLLDAVRQSTDAAAVDRRRAFLERDAVDLAPYVAARAYRLTPPPQRPAPRVPARCPAPRSTGIAAGLYGAPGIDLVTFLAHADGPGLTELTYDLVARLGTSVSTWMSFAELLKTWRLTVGELLDTVASLVAA